MITEGVDLNRFLQVLAATHERLTDLANFLKRQSEVEWVTKTFGCWKYPLNPYPFLEHYVEARMRNRKVLVWALELTGEDGKWTIDAGVAVNDRHGQSGILGFPRRSTESFVDMIEQWQRQTTALVESAFSFDFTPYGETPGQTGDITP